MGPLAQSDWTLIVLAAAGGEPLGKGALQKALFLLSRRRPNLVVGGQFYEFTPHKFGPFCVDIYNDAERMEREGLTNVEGERAWRRYSATPKGMERASEFAVGSEDRAFVNELTRFVRAVDFPRIVRMVYEEFPDMKANSVFHPVALATPQPGSVRAWLETLTSADDDSIKNAFAVMDKHGEDYASALAELESSK